MHVQRQALEVDRHLLGKLAFGQALLETQQLAQAIELQLGVLDTQTVAHGRHPDFNFFQAHPTVEGRGDTAVADIHDRR
ncbi:hypothetical protein D9M68_845090 [compost metagenome]